jgi:hypothetical protein
MNFDQYADAYQEAVYQAAGVPAERSPPRKLE